MDRTPFAGLTALDPTESLATDDSSFQSVNPWVIDRLLRIGVVTHRHDEHAALAAPTAAPTVGVEESGGTIPADVTVTVAYTLIDQYGGETLASPLATGATQQGLADPDSSPTVEANNSAGTLLAGDYAYAVTVADNVGGETVLGPEAQITIDVGFATNQIVVGGLAAIVTAAGGIRWRLWRQVNGGMWNLLAEGTANTFTDDGQDPVNCNVQPPFETDTGTNGSSALTVTVPALPAGAAAFRIYAVEGDTFSPRSLMGEYPAADAGEAQTLTSLDALGAGAPPATPTAIAGAHKITADELDDGVLAGLGGGGGGGTSGLYVGRVVATGLPLAVPDNDPAGAAVSIPVSASGTVGVLRVAVYVAHNYSGDLQLLLRHPDGTELFLANGAGGSGEGYGSGPTEDAMAIFDDAAAQAVASFTTATTFIGAFRPDQALSTVSGRSVTGTWQFVARDIASGDTGEIRAVTLIFEEPAPFVVEDEGTALPARSTVNFVGAGVTATDDADNERTVVTIPGGGGGSSPGAWQALAPYLSAQWEVDPNQPPQYRIDGTRVTWRGWIRPTAASWPDTNGNLVTGVGESVLPTAIRPTDAQYNFIVLSYGAINYGTQNGKSWVLTIMQPGWVTLSFFGAGDLSQSREDHAVCLDNVSYYIS